jgi:hypothetical protein
MKHLPFKRIRSIATDQFEIIDKPFITNNIKIKNDIRRLYVERYRDNIFVDHNVIFKFDYIQKLTETWNEMISFGEAYPFRDRIPPEYIINHLNFVIYTISEAIRAKLIIDFVNKLNTPNE